MCFNGPSPSGQLTVELSEDQVRSYREAVTAILAGDDLEPHMRTLREINVRLRHATRRVWSTQQQQAP